MHLRAFDHLTLRLFFPKSETFRKFSFSLCLDMVVTVQLMEPFVKKIVSLCYTLSGSAFFLLPPLPRPNSALIKGGKKTFQGIRNDNPKQIKPQKEKRSTILHLRKPRNQSAFRICFWKSDYVLNFFLPNFLLLLPLRLRHRGRRHHRPCQANAARKQKRTDQAQRLQWGENTLK